MSAHATPHVSVASAAAAPLHPAPLPPAPLPPAPPRPPGPPSTAPAPPASAASAARPDAQHGSAACGPDIEPQILAVRAWNDPVVDDIGHDPRSAYVETFWLGVLGPTATWILRRFASGLEEHPDGFDLDLATTAAAMGLSYRSGRSSAFTKALQRCVMFGLAHQLPGDGLAVRRRIPPVAQRHLRRMPEALQQQHAEWEADTVTLDELGRAHGLAMAMVDVGDDTGLVEVQLRSLGVSRAVAADVADNVSRLDRT